MKLSMDSVNFRNQFATTHNKIQQGLKTAQSKLAVESQILRSKIYTQAQKELGMLQKYAPIVYEKAKTFTVANKDVIIPLVTAAVVGVIAYKAGSSMNQPHPQAPVINPEDQGVCFADTQPVCPEVVVCPTIPEAIPCPPIVECLVQEVVTCPPVLECPSPQIVEISERVECPTIVDCPPVVECPVDPRAAECEVELTTKGNDLSKCISDNAKIQNQIKNVNTINDEYRVAYDDCKAKLAEIAEAQLRKHTPRKN